MAKDSQSAPQAPKAAAGPGTTAPGARPPESPAVKEPAAPEPIDFTDPERVSLKPRSSRGGKVFTNGFKMPGFSGYSSDLPGKICSGCGFNAHKFSSVCPKCGGELVESPAGI